MLSQCVQRNAGWHSPEVVLKRQACRKQKKSARGVVTLLCATQRLIIIIVPEAFVDILHIHLPM